MAWPPVTHQDVEDAVGALQPAVFDLQLDVGTLQTESSTGRLSDASLRATYGVDANGRRLDSFAVQGLADNPRRLVPVGSKARYLHQSSASNGTDTGFNVRLRQTNPVPVRGLVARFGNVYNQGSAEAPGPNDITIRAAVEFNQISFNVGGLVFWPIFFGGKRDLTLSPGAIVDSDLLGIDLPAGVNWWLRIYGTVASGDKWPVGVLARPSHGDGIQSGTTQTDLTTSAASPPPAATRSPTGRRGCSPPAATAPQPWLWSATPSPTAPATPRSPTTGSSCAPSARPSRCSSSPSPAARSPSSPAT